MNEDGEKIAASHFPGSWVSIGAVAGVGMDTVDHAYDRAQRMTLAFGGDANLGRRQNGITRKQGPDDALGGLTALSDADLSIVNLECVLADGGISAVDKDERVPFYFRGRPEQVQILTEAGVDAVGTANNHSGDYGAAALMEQREILMSAGIAAPGSGSNRQEACAPAFVQRDGLTIAIVSADATLPVFAATEDAPGTCHVSSSDLDGAMTVLGPALASAREEADVVLVAMHWGRNGKSRPTADTRRLGAALIRGGADAVLGSSAHYLQGVELVDGRPILYDAGNILFDSHSEGELTRSGLFELAFDQSGVHAVSLRPIDIGYGRSRYASGNSAARTLSRFRDLSTELGTRVRIRDGVAEIGLPPPPERTVKAIPPRPAGRSRSRSPVDRLPRGVWSSPSLRRRPLSPFSGVQSSCWVYEWVLTMSPSDEPRGLRHGGGRQRLWIRMRGCISGSSPSPIRRSSCGGLTTSTATGRGQRRGGSQERSSGMCTECVHPRLPNRANTGWSSISLSTVSASTTASPFTPSSTGRAKHGT